MSPPSYYAVRGGRQPGIYQSWEECRRNVHGHKGAQYARFSTIEHAEAYMSSTSSKSQIASTHGATRGESIDGGRALKRLKRGKEPRSLETEINQGGDNHLDPIVIYTDGACHGNGQANSRAGYGIYAPEYPSLTRYGPLSLDERHTNQRAELHAVREALLHGPSDRPLIIRTDSRYAKECITRWGDSWERQGWPAEKKNVDLVKTIRELARARNHPIRIEHVPGHAGESGNEMADSLANKGASMVRRL